MLNKRSRVNKEEGVGGEGWRERERERKGGREGGRTGCCFCFSHMVNETIDLEGEKGRRDYLQPLPGTDTSPVLVSRHLPGLRKDLRCDVAAWQQDLELYSRRKEEKQKTNPKHVRPS